MKILTNYISREIIQQPPKMEDLSKLERLSLVSKICVELENHLGINDKDVGTSYYKLTYFLSHFAKLEGYWFLQTMSGNE